jgi:hypothetical protein
LLILGWQAFVFGSTVVPFIITAGQMPPLWLLGLLAVVVALLAMHQAFHWDLLWGENAWTKLADSSLPTRLLFGPVVMAGWVIETMFMGALLGVAMIVVLPFMLPGLLASLWREHRIVGRLRRLGRCVPWHQVLPLARGGQGLLILEARYEEAARPWIDVSRLWWVPPAPELADDPGLPSYRHWLAYPFDGTPARGQSEQRAFDLYQHRDHGCGMLVKVPRLARRHVLPFLASQVPEAVVRVTWRAAACC